MEQIVPVLGVLVNLHKLDKKLPNSVLLEAVDATVTVLVWEDQPQGRVKVVADLLAPSSDKPLDDVASLLVGRELGGSSRAPFVRRTACGLLLVLIKRVEQLLEQVGKCQRLGVVPGTIGVPESCKKLFPGR